MPRLQIGSQVYHEELRYIGKTIPTVLRKGRMPMRRDPMVVVVDPMPFS
jgi:hypothetical protein